MLALSQIVQYNANGHVMNLDSMARKMYNNTAVSHHYKDIVAGDKGKRSPRLSPS